VVEPVVRDPVVDRLLRKFEECGDEWTPEAAIDFLRERGQPCDHILADVIEALNDEVEYYVTLLEDF